MCIYKERPQQIYVNMYRRDTRKDVTMMMKL